MTTYYKYNQFKLSNAQWHRGTSHATCEVEYCNDSGALSKVILKKNKHHNPNLSRMEVAFSQLARLLIPNDLTPHSSLVKDKQQRVVGVAVEMVSEAIHRREGDGVEYIVGDISQSTPEGRIASTPSEIPYYFLDKLPSHVLERLLSGKLNYEVDQASLATVLTAAYTLEEDDLHKGNLGVYFVKRQGQKPKAVFFKVDHDLMFTEQIGSRIDSRFFNWGYKGNAFGVSERDLRHFPLLVDSNNYYWPTSKRFNRFGIGSGKMYQSAEVEAFKQVGINPEFIYQKWRILYKQILVPPALAVAELQRHFDVVVPEDRAAISLVMRAFMSRQAQLRAVLFSIPEFRAFITTMSDKERQSIRDELAFAGDVPSDALDCIEVTCRPHLLNVDDAMKQYKHYCSSSSSDGDTPLHVAIKLNEYRYKETMEFFGNYQTVKNKEGKIPLELVAVGTSISNHLSNPSNEGDEPSEALFNESNYQAAANHVRNYEELKTLIRSIGEDYRYDLKTQKQLSVRCIRFIMERKNHPDQANVKEMMRQFKSDLNKKPLTPEYQYISQLRSRLWIIRWLRGLFGTTSTKVALDNLVDSYKPHRPDDQPRPG